MSSSTTRVLQVSYFLAGPIAGLQPLGFAPLLFATAFALLLAYRVDHGQWLPLPRRNPALVALIAAGCYINLSCLWSTDQADAHPKFLELLLMGISGTMILRVAEELRPVSVLKLQNALLGGLAIGLLTCFGDMAFDGPIKLMHRRWATVNAYDREIISLGLLLFPAALIGFRRGYKWIALTLLAAYTGGILFLQSHSAMAGMIFGLAALAVGFYRPRIVRLGLCAGFILGLLACIPVAFYLQHLGLDQSKLQFSFRHRVQIWSFTAERILHRPLFGYGLDGSRAIPTSDLAPGFLPLGHDHPEPHPHNIFLQIWLELGVVGVILTGAFVVQLIQHSASLPRRTQVFMLAMGTAWLTIATFAFGVWQGWWLALLAYLIMLVLIAGRGTKDADTDAHAA